MFALADEERLRTLLRDSGFDVMRTEDVPVRFVFRDVDDYVTRARDTGGMFSAVWNQVSAEERREMREELAAAFAAYEVAGRYELPGLALTALAS
jgi:hypothetical protein